MEGNIAFGVLPSPSDQFLQDGFGMVNSGMYRCVSQHETSIKTAHSGLVDDDAGLYLHALPGSDDEPAKGWFVFNSVIKGFGDFPAIGHFAESMNELFHNSSIKGGNTGKRIINLYPVIHIVALYVICYLAIAI